MKDVEIDAAKVIAILREENPMVLELAMRRARIEELEKEVDSK